MKKKNKKQLQTFEDGPNYAKIVITTIVVLVSIALLYFITAYFVTGELRDSNEQAEETVTIQYEEILAGTLFDMPPAEYHVLIMEHNSPNFFGAYGLARNNDTPLFTIDTGKGINQSIITKDSEHISNNVTTLKVTDPTILLIRNGSIVSSASGLENIRTFLSE